MQYKKYAMRYIPVLVEYTIHTNTHTVNYHTSATMLQNPDDRNKQVSMKPTKQEHIANY